MNKFWLVVFMIACSSTANSQFSVELNAGTERAVAHVKVFKYIDKRNRWSLYSGNQVAVNFDVCKPTFFSANILAYNFRSGIGISTILIAGKDRLHPSVGLQYQKTIKSFYFYFLSTYELKKIARQENYIILLYKHKLSEKVKFIFHNENYVRFLKSGYDQSVQRIKLGFEIRHTQVGFISETSQIEKSHQTTLVNLGCFIKQSF